MNPRESIHFCSVPARALCGVDLSQNDFELFYDNTANCFADVTCKGCQREIMKTHLVGFKEPKEWHL